MPLKNIIWGWITALLLSVSVATALAQDHQAAGTYANLNLHAGFIPDPEVISVDAGGSFAAGSLGSDCFGYINPDAPDVVLDFTHARQALNIYAISNADTTLVVRAPNGHWLCNDDSHGVNPLVTLTKPASGRYAIWVGLYASGTFQPAQLYLSEMEPQWTAGFTANVTAEPLYGVVSLARGFKPDPHQVLLLAGGDVDASGLGFGCNGYIAADQPDVVIELDGSLTRPTVYAVSDSDTTLVIHTPEGEWLCNDDTYEFNPAITLSGTPGAYAVWVGVFGGGTAEAELYITAGAPQWSPAKRPEYQPPEPMLDITGLNAYEVFLQFADMAPPDGMSWSSAEPLGEEGFTVRDLVIRPDAPADMTELRLGYLVVNRIDWDAIVRESPPTYLDIALQGLIIPVEDWDDEEWAQHLNLQNLVINLQMAYALDEATGMLQLSPSWMEIEDLGRMDASLHITGVAIDEVMMALMMDDPTGIQSGVVNAELSYQDYGFLSKVLQVAAEEEGQTLPGLIERLVGEMRAQLADLGLADDAQVKRMASAVEQFMRDIPQGTAPLSLRLNPPATLDLAALFGLLAEPNRAMEILGLSLDYVSPPR